LFLLVAACSIAQALAAATGAADPSPPAPSAIKNSLGMQFVPIPAGEFLMGSADDDVAADSDEHPRHAVRISKSFHLGRFEVTQADYRAVMNDNPSWFSPAGGGRDEVRNVDTSRRPVEFVTWEEATEFCRRLSALPAEREAGRTYRLPTEAEWEYAARAGTTTRFAVGERLTDGAAAVRLESDAAPQATAGVGAFRANAWGLHDMHGNVWEWCADYYDAAYYEFLAHGERKDPAIDPQGPPTGPGRVVRGGDYRFDASQARSANRDFTRQSRRDWGNGFRVVLVAGGDEK
jgi:formylglycine-generating enzyme required for sulfatase activity